jgi:hypothetical protein
MFLFIAGIQPRKVIADIHLLNCPRCRKNSAQIKRVDSYFSLFFLPLFPVKRGSQFIECNQCGYRESMVIKPQASDTSERGMFYPSFESGGEHTGSSTCPHCGAEIRPDYKYCPYCGEKLCS